ncbi:MAG TPA: RHS repeat-associated core domain-containing protein, partial [Terriglobia bacterium]|nr:RHS repeat-associated core domain-containing protein [Terriglobia bacterium]
MGRGCTPVEETWDFNNRLQPVRIQVGNSSNPSALACLVYNYYAGVSNPSSCAAPAQATSGNNGNVMGYDDLDNASSNVSHTAAYTYDGVNRLTVAQATGNSTYNLDFIYTQDGSNGQFGNMSCLLNGDGTTVGPCPQFTFSSSTNRITTSGYAYDAAGNVTNDGVHAYTWDAEGRIATVDAGSTATYTYDALGRRVEGDVGGDQEYFYVYDPAGNLLDAPLGVLGEDELTEPVAGRVLASYVNGRSYTYFKHGNALGSWGLITMQDGSVPQDQLYYPWGQTWTSGHYLFEPNYAAMTWYNPESDLFLTPARSYGSRLGRWMSPDPAGLAAVNPADPQSWNRYAYVRNNPTSLTDPSGLFRHQPPDDANSVDISDLLWDLLNGFVDPPGGGGSVGGGGSQAPFSQAKYNKCCQQAFGTTSGNIPGTDKTILSYDASEDVLMAAAATGVSATV